jgi:glycosyltransferase involved in cell wall biosynthesis
MPPTNQPTIKPSNKAMKILMLLIGFDFPPDIRVEKEMRALLTAGHQVVIVCENRKQRVAREQWHGVELIRLPPQPGWWRQLNTAALLITQRNPLWESQVSQIVAAEKPDALHVHDLPFVGPALRIARRHHLPLVADLHENYPAHFRTRRPTIRNPLEWFAFDPERFAHYERRVLPECDRVIVVVDEAAERVEKLGVRADRIYVVGNTEDVESSPADAPPLPLPDAELTLMYVGGLQANRGLDTVIEAMPKIRARLPTARCVIVGDGVHRAALEALTRRLGMEGAIRFEGQQPFQKVRGYISAGDICLVPHAESEEINTTIPHKLFQYMYLRKPVIVSSARPLKRIVEQSGAGLVFASGDPDAFAEAVFGMTDPALRRRMGENGHRAVVEQYNWQNDSQALIRLYEGLAILRLL